MVSHTPVKLGLLALVCSVSFTVRASDDAGQEGSTLQEVVVTAQKREQALQDVPIPVAVISGAALTENNQVKLTDYYTQVPGLSVAPSTQSTQTLSIRGITTGAVPNGPPAPGPTVGIMIDGVPFGGTGGGDTMVPDFDPGDLARIEVLRGPQGTLYGASSLGGLINFVTQDPSTDAIHGRLEAGTDTIYNGSELGYNARGSVNLPVTSDLAVRASGYARQDAGYIDNPVLGIDGINADKSYGGHLAALWTVSDSFTVKLSALYQQVRGGGTNDVTPNPPAISGFPATLGDLQQGYIRGVGPYFRKTQGYNAVLTDKIGPVTVTSLTGYNSYSIHDETDNTYSLGSLTQPFFGVTGTPQYDHISFGRFTEELRIAASLGSNLDLLLGGFYSHAVDRYKWDEYATDPFSGAVAGYWGTFNENSAPITYTDYAGFADLTYHVTDRFDVQFGGRESEYDVVGRSWIYNGLIATVWVGPPICTASPCVAFPEYTLKQNAFTYLFTPSFKITPDIMAYARLASGFREGGENAGTPDAPASFGPDKTRDYDLGLKGNFLEHTLSVDASVYYIDWQQLQLPLFTPLNLSYTGNAGSAKSEGVELSVESKPVQGLTVAAWIAYNEAELTAYVPSIYGYPGDPLPNTPRFSGNFSPKYEFPLWGPATGYVAGTIAFVGAREDVFSQASPERQYLPPYSKTDLRAGTQFNDWTVNVYVNNLTDKRGIISGGYGNAEPFAFYLIQPRTVGISVAKTF